MAPGHLPFKFLVELGYYFADFQEEDVMNITKLFEIASKDKRLNTLGLAIAEAKMTRSLLRKKQKEQDPADLERLNELEKKIDEMESTLFEIESEEHPAP